jgi:TetR/AcrR family acrAB operon transcriptional repressor
MRRTKEEAEITRQRLLKKGLEIFSQKVYADTTLQDIAREAGVTRGAIYWHFGSKADLYNTLVQKYSSKGNEILAQAVAEGGTLADILRRVFVRQLQAIAADHEFRAMMELYLFKTGPTAELEEGRRQQIEASSGLIEMLTGIMAQGAELGLLRTDTHPEHMARTYLALQNGLIQMWLLTPTRFSLEKDAEAFADILMAGLSSTV